MSERRARVDLDELAVQAMRDRGMVPDFPRDVMQEVSSIGGPAARPDGVEDLTGTPFFSIDNDDSRDLDQLTWAEQHGESIIIRIAVADVDALVKKDGAIDSRARENTTSVYTPTEIFHMLPEQLSTDWTSLNENENRAAMVFEAQVGKDGSIERGAVYRGWVRNHAKLAYDNVSEWLSDDGSLPDETPESIRENIRIQVEATHRLLNHRHEEGALDLDTLEPRAVLDNGRVVGMELWKKNDARQVIEDFMIAANGVSARFLGSRDFPVFRRVVRTPKRWERIVDVAAEYGEKLPPEPDSAALEKFLVRMKKEDPVRFPDLSLTIIKLLGRGEYVVEQGATATGHFGLAVRDYAHSTAPNRRYPDLITHRLLKAALAGEESPYTMAELQELAAHCTKREDDANKVERFMTKAAAAQMLLDRVGQRFDGIVTGASAKGTWVRLFDPPVEGKLVRGHEGLDVGDRVRVKLLDANPERGFIDFGRAS